MAGDAYGEGTAGFSDLVIVITRLQLCNCRPTCRVSLAWVMSAVFLKLPSVLSLTDRRCLSQRRKVWDVNGRLSGDTKLSGSYGMCGGPFCAVGVSSANDGFRSFVQRKWLLLC